MQKNTKSKDTLRKENAKQKIKMQTRKDEHVLLEEIQDLESQILDMFEVAFHFAGLKTEHLDDALEYYMEVMENQDDSLLYTPQEIIANIMLVKQDNPSWFQ